MCKGLLFLEFLVNEHPSGVNDLYEFRVVVYGNAEVNVLEIIVKK